MFYSSYFDFVAAGGINVCLNTGCLVVEVEVLLAFQKLKLHWLWLFNQKGWNFSIFYTLDRIIRAYCFCPVCLFVCFSVCLSIVNFNIRYNFWTVGDFIFGLYTQLINKCSFKWHQGEWPCDLDFDLNAKNCFSNFVATGSIVFHKLMYFYVMCLCSI